MRGFVDPFYGYSFLLRTIVYVIIPLFGVWQFVRLRRALHVFQLEAYKRHWFRRWLRENPGRRLFLSSFREAKKPLVMTGRAWRMLIKATAVSVAAILLPSAAAHLIGGAPWDLITCALMLGLVFWGAPHILLFADWGMTPVQAAINGRFLRAARRKLADVGPTVIGVTGSFGKTSTKFAIQQLLGAPDEVLATPGSFNTPLGVSRAVNENLDPNHRFFVVEMGARQEGDIAEVAQLVKPSVGVLTAVGPAHLESFGSLEAIARGKYELIEALPSSGTAVMNVGDPVVRQLADATTDKAVVRYGIEAVGAPDITVADLWLVERGTSVTILDKRTGDQLQVKTRLVGRHAIGHILAAVAVALATGRELADLKAAIEAMEPVEHRLQIIDGAGGVTVIDDAYNSNPSGAAAALEVLRQMPGGRKVVVTPGMVELGPLQDEANEAFGRQAAEAADTLIVVAKLNRRAILAGAGQAGGADVITVDTLSEASRELQGLLKPGDIVLFENDLPDQYEG
ncbi:MAG: UDP-N-acetylmuramoyl-tripeptide--D-alanyl-D-alanine ligase [Actinomycetota bacterium]